MRKKSNAEGSVGRPLVRFTHVFLFIFYAQLSVTFAQMCIYAENASARAFRNAKVNLEKIENWLPSPRTSNHTDKSEGKSEQTYVRVEIHFNI